MQAFISYRRGTGGIYANELIKFFQKNDIEAFLDIVSLNAYSGEFSEPIKEGIASAKDFIVILSDRNLDEIYEKHGVFIEEILYARRLEKRIIPILCGDVTYEDLKKLTGELSFLARMNCLEIKDMKQYESLFFKALCSRMTATDAVKNAQRKLEGGTKLESRAVIEGRLSLADRLEGDVISVDICAVVANGLLNTAGEYFEKLADRGCRIRIVINDPASKAFATACEFKFEGGGSMRQKMRWGGHSLDYLSDWMADYPENFFCRLTDFDLPCAIFIVERENEEKSAIKLDFYDFACTDSERRSAIISKGDADNYAFYKKQFEWIWEHARSLSDNEE